MARHGLSRLCSSWPPWPTSHRLLLTLQPHNPRCTPADLCADVLHRTLPKPSGVRCGRWEARPLSAAQRNYAALDAFASLMLHMRLMQLPLRQALEGSEEAPPQIASRPAEQQQPTERAGQ